MITGDPLSVQTIHGPFDTDEAAGEWAHASGHHRWVIKPVMGPEMGYERGMRKWVVRYSMETSYRAVRWASEPPWVDFIPRNEDQVEYTDDFTIHEVEPWDDQSEIPE